MFALLALNCRMPYGHNVCLICLIGHNICLIALFALLALHVYNLKGLQLYEVPSKNWSEAAWRAQGILDGPKILSFF